MSRAQILREWLAAQPKPVKTMEIVQALGFKRTFVNSTVQDLVQRGHVIRIDTHTPSRYRIGAPVKRIPKHPTEEARKAAIAASRRKSRPTVNARLRRQSAERRKQHEAELRKAKKWEATQARKQALAAKQDAKRAERVARIVKRLQVVAVEQAPLITSEQWLRENPTARIEQLAPGATSGYFSQPLKGDYSRRAAA